MNLLLRILKYKRPHLSFHENVMISKVIDPIKGMVKDSFGNRIISIPEADGSAPRVLFSAHTDTVHRTSGVQTVFIDPETKVISKDDGECLGADDGAGIWMLIQLINNRTPGLYIFHRGEEVGGLGSSWIVENTAIKLFKDIDIAIAFDRKNIKSIITHQGFAKCCSNAFAVSLAKELDMGHECDDGGSFTDTANYKRLIQECTNVSIGYYSEHRPAETLDYAYLMNLKRALLNVNWSRLTVARSVSDVSSPYRAPVQYGTSNYGNSNFGNFGHNSYGGYRDRHNTALDDRRAARGGKNDNVDKLLTFSDAYDLCLFNPKVAADLIRAYKITEGEVTEAQSLFGFDQLDHMP